MPISQVCASSLKDLAVFVFQTSNGDQLKPLVWLVAGTATLVRLVLKLRIPEALDLAATLRTGLVFAIVIMVTGSPAAVKATSKLRQCIVTDTQVVKLPAGGQRRTDEGTTVVQRRL
jgi:hypothetical protein